LSLHGDPEWPPAEVDAPFVVDLRIDQTMSKELDRVFPPLLVRIVVDLGDGRRIESTSPIPRSKMAQVADDIDRRLPLRCTQFRALQI
jgi:hypothetical protein